MQTLVDILTKISPPNKLSDSFELWSEKMPYFHEIHEFENKAQFVKVS